jgi:hypothetical protein
MEEDRIYQLRQTDGNKSQRREGGSVATRGQRASAGTPGSVDRVCSGSTGGGSKRKEAPMGEQPAAGSGTEEAGDDGNNDETEQQRVTTGSGSSGGDVVYKKIRHVLQMIDK